jgi:tRNA 2-thiouridine synthesizing protein A
MTVEIFDFRGLKCPLPALFARRALERALEGTEIEILTDDPMAPIDVPHMCRQEGFDVVALERDGDSARMVLRRPTASVPAADRDGPERPAP